jgi:hypothetical protein
MDGGLGQPPTGFGIDVSLEPVLEGNRLSNMEFAESLKFVLCSNWAIAAAT